VVDWAANQRGEIVENWGVFWWISVESFQANAIIKEREGYNSQHIVGITLKMMLSGGVGKDIWEI
jgi:hypothetical protein